MNAQDKQTINARYEQAKEKGVRFFPDIIFKDLAVSFALFVLLVGLAAFIGVETKPPADPTDTSYIPRPEWYFLFLFELLKFFPGAIEFVGTVILPVAAILVLFLLPFIDRRIQRHPLNRPVATGLMVFVLIAMVGLTIRAVITTPEQAEALGFSYQEQLAAGEELYLTLCAECHQPEGEGGEVVGVEGMEGKELDPINSQDFLYTRSDDTIYNVIDYGQPTLGMQAFGLANGGELNDQQITAIVTFLRSWDDRIVVEGAESGPPPLAEGEEPDYETHVYPIFRRYCIACHRQGNSQQNYVMTDYVSVMTSGDHAPNVIAGDLDSNLIRMLNQEDIEAGGPMPPTKALDAYRLDVVTRWVEAGALPARVQEPAEQE